MPSCDSKRDVFLRCTRLSVVPRAKKIPIAMRICIRRARARSQTFAGMQVLELNQRNAELGGSEMSATNLPLGVCQRIEQRWSQQIKRLQAERDLKAKAALSDLGDDTTSTAPVDIVEWGKQRDH